jgi:hypothetical protein
MANTLDELYNQDNPNPAANTSAAERGPNLLTQQYHADNPLKDSTDTAPAVNYIGKGALSGSSVFTSPEEQAAINDPFMGEQAQQAVSSQKEALKNLEPSTSENPSGFHRALEEGAKGAVESSLFGPGQALIGGIAGAVKGYTGSPLLGILAGIGTGTAGNIVQKATSTGSSAFNQANKNLGLEGASVAEAKPSSSLWRRTYDWLMGSPGGTNTTSEAAQARNTTAESAIDKLAAGNATRTEAGAEVQSSAAQQVKNISAENTDIINKLDAVRETDRVDPGPYIGALDKILSAPAPGEASVVDPLQPKLIQNLFDGLEQALAKSPDDRIGYNTAKIARTLIGNRLDSAIAEGDGTTVGQLKILYRSLSETMRGAFTGMNRVAFDKANLDMFQNFELKEQVLGPLIKEGVTPEKIFNWTGNEAKLGATKLLSIKNAIDPEAWKTFAGTTLQLMGRNRNGEFDLATYATRWDSMPKEVQNALFADTPYSELPQAYKDLALVASHYKQAGLNYNRSESGNVVNLAQMVSEFIHGMVATGGSLGTGAAIHQMGGGNDYADLAAAGVAGAGTAFGMYKMGSAGVEYLTQNMLAKLATYPPFVKWAAAEVPAKAFPKYLNSLSSYIAVHDPDMKVPFSVFTNYLDSKQQQIQVPGDKLKAPLARMGGGVVDFPEQTPTGYAGGGPGAQWQKMSEGYVGGGVAASPFDGNNGNILGYAQGGISHNTDDPRPFYNAQLPRVAGGGGYAEGGHVEASAMGYADGGPTDNPDLAVLDMLMPGWRATGLDEDIAGHKIPNANDRAGMETLQQERWDTRNDPPRDAEISKLGDDLTNKDITEPKQYAEGGNVKGYSLADMKTLATNAGFKGADADKMAALAMVESSGNPQAHNTKGEDSYGLTQINAHAWGPIAKQALDPQKAFELAHMVFEKQGWGAWKNSIPGAAQYLNGESIVASNTPRSHRTQEESEPKSILDHFIIQNEEEPQEEQPQEQDNGNLIETINAAPWAAPETKFAAKHILAEA